MENLGFGFRKKRFTVEKSKELRKLIMLIARVGIGFFLMLAGTIFLIYSCLLGKIDWPDWIITGSILMLCGLIAFTIDVIKEIWIKKIDAHISKSNFKKYCKERKSNNETKN